jgi:hypothetical protein
MITKERLAAIERMAIDPHVFELLAYVRELEWQNNIFKNEVKALLQTMPIDYEDNCDQSICDLCDQSKWCCAECPPVTLAKLIGLDSAENERT